MCVKVYEKKPFFFKFCRAVYLSSDTVHWCTRIACIVWYKILIDTKYLSLLQNFDYKKWYVCFLWLNKYSSTNFWIIKADKLKCKFRRMYLFWIIRDKICINLSMVKFWNLKISEYLIPFSVHIDKNALRFVLSAKFLSMMSAW